MLPGRGVLTLTVYRLCVIILHGATAVSRHKSVVKQASDTRLNPCARLFYGQRLEGEK